jgi:hypothetical protein
VLLEAEQDADSVIVEKAVTVISMIEVAVSAGAVVVPLHVISEYRFRSQKIANSHLLRNYRLLLSRWPWRESQNVEDPEV